MRPACTVFMRLSDLEHVPAVALVSWAFAQVYALRRCLDEAIIWNGHQHAHTACWRLYHAQSQRTMADTCSSAQGCQLQTCFRYLPAQASPVLPCLFIRRQSYESSYYYDDDSGGPAWIVQSGIASAWPLKQAWRPMTTHAQACLQLQHSSRQMLTTPCQAG